MASVAECVSECAEEWRERESVEDMAECGECGRDGVMWLSVVSAVSVAKHGECGDCVGVCWSMVDCCCVWRNTVRVTDSVATMSSVSERIECDGVWQSIASAVNISECVVVWMGVASVAVCGQYGECAGLWLCVAGCVRVCWCVMIIAECGGVWRVSRNWQVWWSVANEA